jgi:hypothetical protein
MSLFASGWVIVVYLLSFLDYLGCIKSCYYDIILLLHTMAVKNKIL